MFKLSVDDEIDLCLYEPNHAEAVYTLADNNREHIGAHLPWIYTTQSVSDIRDFVNRSRHSLAEKGDIQAAIFYTGEFAGSIGLMMRDSHAAVGEIGYWLGSEFTNKGIMTRASRAMTDFGFTELGLNRIIIRCATENIRSSAVAERLGYVYEGTHRQEVRMPDRLEDLRYYSMLADDWEITYSDKHFCHKIDDSLELRLLEERHNEILFGLIYGNRKYLKKWQSWVHRVHTMDDTQEFIRKSLKQYADYNGWYAGIWYEGVLVGVAGYKSWNFTHQKTALAYWLSEAASGKGIMTRVVASLVDYAIFDLKLNRVEITCGTDNAASCAIPLRLGFTHEGVLRDAERLFDRYIDCNVYSILSADWLDRDHKKAK